MSGCTRCDLQRELDRLSRSSLLQAGGYGIYSGLIGPSFSAFMLDEALQAHGRRDQIVFGADTEEIRGGAPAREVICVEGGNAQDRLLATPALDAFVAGEVGLPVRRLGQRASYSIYAGPTSHLDIHRDIVGCDLALVSCLYDSHPASGGGAFDLWLDDLATPLSYVRANPEKGRSRIALYPGESLLIHGGLIPHRIPQPGMERLRVVSLVCYELPDNVKKTRPVNFPCHPVAALGQNFAFREWRNRSKTGTLRPLPTGGQPLRG